MNIIEKMELTYHEMGASEKKVCRLIMDNPVYMTRYTIVQVADLANTSTSAVQRFCQKLGFHGYNDLRYEMMNYLSGPEEESEKDQIFQLVEDFASAVSKLDKVDRKQYDRIADDILSSEKVLILGRYRNSVVAEKMRMNLTDLGITCLAGTSGLEFEHLLYVMNQNTCVILIAALGEGQGLANFLSQMKENTNKTWLLTHAVKPKMGRYVKEVISLPYVHEKNFSPVTSHSIMMTFMEILTLHLSQKINKTAA